MVRLLTTLKHRSSHPLFHLPFILSSAIGFSMGTSKGRTTLCRRVLNLMIQNLGSQTRWIVPVSSPTPQVQWGSLEIPIFDQWLLSPQCPVIAPTTPDAWCDTVPRKAVSSPISHRLREGSISCSYRTHISQCSFACWMWDYSEVIQSKTFWDIAFSRFTTFHSRVFSIQYF